MWRTVLRAILGLEYVSPLGRNFRYDLWDSSLPELEERLDLRLFFFLFFPFFVECRRERDEERREVLEEWESEDDPRVEGASREKESMLERRTGWRTTGDVCRAPADSSTLTLPTLSLQLPGEPSEIG